jgi:hypothetical protein
VFQPVGHYPRRGNCANCGRYMHIAAKGLCSRCYAWSRGQNSERAERVDIARAAAALGRNGGLKGGPARAATLTPERRSEIARRAALARWGRAETEVRHGDQN